MSMVFLEESAIQKKSTNLSKSGVFIEGIKMPERCCDCPCRNSENGRCSILGICSEYVPRICPMREANIGGLQ